MPDAWCRCASDFSCHVVDVLPDFSCQVQICTESPQPFLVQWMSIINSVRLAGRIIDMPEHEYANSTIFRHNRICDISRTIDISDIFIDFFPLSLRNPFWMVTAILQHFSKSRPLNPDVWCLAQMCSWFLMPCRRCAPWFLMPGADVYRVSATLTSWVLNCKVISILASWDSRERLFVLLLTILLG